MKRKITRKQVFKRFRILVLTSVFIYCALAAANTISAQSSATGPVLMMTIDGPINPAANDYLKSSIQTAEERGARLLVLKLNTPGGLLPSMQSMVEQMLESPIPIVVYVSPSGGGAISAGVFITMAGHVAVMAPGTTIGAAHPVTGAGQDVGGDMRAKVENFAVSHIKAIAEQRGRNGKWAEEAVRESVAITDREALDKKVIDFIAADMQKLLTELEGKTLTIKGEPVTLKGLTSAQQVELEMSFKQKVVNILSDPNITILLGLGAMLGIGLELYHPGLLLPGICGVICLVLSLTAAQVLPINYGGLALLLLGVVFIVIESFLPSFGIWGGAGIICLVLGAIYFVDSDMVWSASGFEVDPWFVGPVAALVGVLLVLVGYLAMRTFKTKVSTGAEGLLSKVATVKDEFTAAKHGSAYVGKVYVMGELWKAEIKAAEGEELTLSPGQKVKIKSIESGMLLRVELFDEEESEES